MCDYSLQRIVSASFLNSRHAVSQGEMSQYACYRAPSLPLKRI